VQLACFAVAFALAGLVGYTTFVATVALVWIASVTLIERRAAGVALVVGWPRLRSLAVAAALIATSVAVVVSR
jgi:hypothetical protein